MHMLVVKIRDNFDPWEAGELSFDELLRRVKAQARPNIFDTYVSRGKAGVAVGSQQRRGNNGHEESPCFGELGQESTDINMFNRKETRWGQKEKGKGKGKLKRGC